MNQRSRLITRTETAMSSRKWSIPLKHPCPSPRPGKDAWDMHGKHSTLPLTAHLPLLLHLLLRRCHSWVGRGGMEGLGVRKVIKRFSNYYWSAGAKDLSQMRNSKKAGEINWHTVKIKDTLFTRLWHWLFYFIDLLIYLVLDLVTRYVFM